MSLCYSIYLLKQSIVSALSTTIISSVALFLLQYYLQFLFLCTNYRFCNIDLARTVNNYQFFDRHMFLLSSYKVFYVLTTISSSVGVFSLQYYLQSLFCFCVLVIYFVTLKLATNISSLIDTCFYYLLTRYSMSLCYSIYLLNQSIVSALSTTVSF